MKSNSHFKHEILQLLKWYYHSLKTGENFSSTSKEHELIILFKKQIIDDSKEEFKKQLTKYAKDILKHNIKEFSSLLQNRAQITRLEAEELASRCIKEIQIENLFR